MRILTTFMSITLYIISTTLDFMETRSNAYENAEERKNLRHLAYWTGSWGLTIAPMCAFGPKFLWDFNSSISILAVLVNTIIGLGMIQMHRKYANGLDEMQRKIFMEAKAFALGIGVVGGLSYSMLDAANVISFHAEIGHLVMLIGVAYVIAYIVGSIRYKMKNRIKVLRAERNMTQEDLRNRSSGLSADHQMRLKKGNSIPAYRLHLRFPDYLIWPLKTFFTMSRG